MINLKKKLFWDNQHYIFYTIKHLTWKPVRRRIQNAFYAERYWTVNDLLRKKVDEA